MKRFSLLLCSIILSIFSAHNALWAQNYTVSGTVHDGRTQNPLYGANVVIAGTTLGAATDEAGRFSIRNVPAGEQTVEVSFLGYFKQKKIIRLNANTAIDFALKPRSIESQEIIITETRARERETPVAFTNITRNELKQRYDLEDIPMLLNEIPGVYSYSETGGSIGYTYMKIRGFDQSRIAVMLNGIPLNDPESHQVYWVDLADFGENIQNIQVQRGVGNSLYGASAIGGSVNVITHNFSDKRNIAFKTGYGSYRTKKASLGMSSGLIDDKYAIYGRFSRLLSDGYRDNSWADLWSYFFSAVRFDDNMTNKVNVYGGPELTHLTYDGVTREYLEGKITGDRGRDRKYNPLSDQDGNRENDIDVDDTFQPHYELLTEIVFNDNVHFNNALFYTAAKGFYRNVKNRRELYEYNLEPFFTSDPTPYLEFADFEEPDGGIYELKKIDLVRRRWVDNYQWGAIPRIEFEHSNGILTVGAELRNHSARHWGEVIWAPVPIPNLSPNQTYYDYEVDKKSYSGYIHESFSPKTGLTIMADLQYSYHNYKFSNDKRKNYDFDVSYKFLTPRLGANYNINDNLNVFGNFSIAQREPVFRSIYDAQYVYSEPLFEDEENFKNPLMKAEKMFDYETGFGYISRDFTAKVNVYYMNFRNEVIRYGGQLVEGIAVAGNAKKSYHSGIEVSTAYRIAPELTLQFNAVKSRNRLKTHSEYINNWANWPPGEEVNYDGNRIGGFPENIFNGVALFQKNGFTTRLHLQYIGNQFIDNSENERKNPELRSISGYVNKTIGSYTLLNARFSYRLQGIKGLENAEIGLSIHNILNEEYEAAGYIDEVPLWIPGPNRNFFLGLSIEM